MTGDEIHVKLTILGHLWMHRESVLCFSLRLERQNGECIAQALQLGFNASIPFLIGSAGWAQIKYTSYCVLTSSKTVAIGSATWNSPIKKGVVGGMLCHVILQ